MSVFSHYKQFENLLFQCFSDITSENVHQDVCIDKFNFLFHLVGCSAGLSSVHLGRYAHLDITKTLENKDFQMACNTHTWWHVITPLNRSMKHLYFHHILSIINYLKII